MSANFKEKSTGNGLKTQAISLLWFVQVMDSIRLTNNFREMLLNATESVFRSEFTGSAMLSVLKRLFRKPTAVCAPFVIIELIILSAMILNRRPPLMLSEKVSLSLRLLQNNSFLLSAIVLKQGATMRCFTQTAVF